VPSGLYTLEVTLYDSKIYELFNHSSNNRQECVEAFEKAKIFDGMTIYEAESEIEVIFG
jgi:hypothetical protein